MPQKSAKKIGSHGRSPETGFIVLLKSLCCWRQYYSAVASTATTVSVATVSPTATVSTATSSTTSTESTASAASAFSALLPQEIIERPARTAKDKNNFFISLKIKIIKQLFVLQKHCKVTTYFHSSKSFHKKINQKTAVKHIFCSFRCLLIGLYLDFQSIMHQHSSAYLLNIFRQIKKTC